MERLYLDCCSLRCSSRPCSSRATFWLWWTGKHRSFAMQLFTRSSSRCWAAAPLPGGWRQNLMSYLLQKTVHFRPLQCVEKSASIELRLSAKWVDVTCCICSVIDGSTSWLAMVIVDLMVALCQAWYAHLMASKPRRNRAPGHVILW